MGIAEPVIGRRFAPTRWLRPSYAVMEPSCPSFAPDLAINSADVARMNVVRFSHGDGRECSPSGPC